MVALDLELTIKQRSWANDRIFIVGILMKFKNTLAIKKISTTFSICSYLMSIFPSSN